MYVGDAVAFGVAETADDSSSSFSQLLLLSLSPQKPRTAAAGVTKAEYLISTGLLCVYTFVGAAKPGYLNAPFRAPDLHTGTKCLRKLAQL